MLGGAGFLPSTVSHELCPGYLRTHMQRESVSGEQSQTCRVVL